MSQDPDGGFTRKFEESETRVGSSRATYGFVRDLTWKRVLMIMPRQLRARVEQGKGGTRRVR